MKKIISLFLIGLILCSRGIKTRANSGVDFEGDSYNPRNALKRMYGDEYTWRFVDIRTIDDITNHQILEVQSDDFGEDIINGEMANLGIYKPYAGCGPIAMMGIVEYFSRLCPQLEIVKDGTSDLYEIAM